MSAPILATKLYVPPPRPQAVLRSRLIERLNAGLRLRLTLISAPAGFGKSTLLSAWVVECGRPVGWLSLDEGDGDLARFLKYLVAALQTISPTIGAGVFQVLQSPQLPPIESILTALLNEISVAPMAFVLILDDYHVIDAKPVDDALTFLLEHMPPQMHLVIATREDPQLPLPRLRARGHLSELRASDLRFTASEVAAFLKNVMGLDLMAADIAKLEARTEGWIAGLQLAALSMQGRQDVSGFIRAFTGDHHYILDYLVEEVLQRQPKPDRDFLLQTSVLDQLYGPLCDAVTGQEDGTARLEAFHRGNFFVVPLDDKRHWYRYHHLFVEALAARLKAEQPDQVSTLHQRASAWYEHDGSAIDAIRHALIAKDFERAARLVEHAAPAMYRSRQEATALGWFKALPDEVVRRRPVLSAAYASALLSNGEFNHVEDWLRDAEHGLDAATSTRPQRGSPNADVLRQGNRRTRPAAMIVVDDEAFNQLPGAIAVSRAGLALARGDVLATVNYARRALDLIPEDDHRWRGAAAALLGLASWASGDLEGAYRMYSAGMAHFQRIGNIADTIAGAVTRADLRIAQGRLHEAMQIYEHGLQRATTQGPDGTQLVLRGAADMHIGICELRRERNDLHAARQHLLLSAELGEYLGFPQNPYRRRVAMARIRQIEGDLHAALELLDEAERLYMSDFSPNVRPIAALKARVWVGHGQLGKALDWAQKQRLSAHDDLSYLREYEHITLARVLLARYVLDRTDQSLHEALGLLDRLLHAAEAGERTGSVIEILVVQALAYQMQDNIPAALVPLQRALKLTEPEGYVRIFVDEGKPMAALLQSAERQGITSTYMRGLLAAFDKTDNGASIKQPVNVSLSDRELEVLRLLGTYLSGPDIARELIVSLNTLRTHIKHIYDKLGVNSRQEAVRRAKELNLV